MPPVVAPVLHTLHTLDCPLFPAQWFCNGVPQGSASAADLLGE